MKKRKTITFDKLRQMSVCNSPKLNEVVVNGVVKKWVGIGFIDMDRKPNDKDVYVVD